MAERPPPAYQGGDPYVFVSYSHEDVARVYPDVRWLQDQGVNVWYDEGISGASRWRDAIAGRLAGCHLLLYFVSPSSVASQVCREELEFALDHDRPVLSVYLEPTELPDGISLALSNRQALIRQDLAQGEYGEKLLASIGTYLDRDVTAATSGSMRRPRRSYSSTAVIAAAAVGLLFAAIAQWLFLESKPVASQAHKVVRLALPIIDGARLTGGLEMEESQLGMQRPSRLAIALSPNGEHLVYLARKGDKTQLYRRALDQVVSQPIPGTKGASDPFFSPDSRFVAFGTSVEGRLETKAVDLAGSDVRTIVPPDTPFFPRSWTGDGRILGSLLSGAIAAVPATGGALVELTTVNRDAGEAFHWYPQLLPGGRGLLYNVGNERFLPSDWDVVVQTLDADARRITITESGSFPRYVDSGHILFAREGRLLAVPFDVESLEVLGAPVIVLDDVMHAERGSNTDLNFGAAQFSVSSGGHLAHVPGGIYPATTNQLVWLPVTGETEIILREETNKYLFPRFSPDGARLAFILGTFPRTELWVYDIELQVKLFLVGGALLSPVWSPDGTRIAFADDGILHWIAADGSGNPAPIADGTEGVPGSWSSQNVLAFLRGNSVWTVAMDASNEPEKYLEDSGIFPAFSPDGNWLAYSSGEQPYNVFIRPYPSGGPIPVSSGGGWAPTWSPNGRQLFYLTEQDGTERLLMMVELTDDPANSRSKPRLARTMPKRGTSSTRSYDMSPQGDRFVSIADTPISPQPATQVHITLNWFNELSRLAPNHPVSD